MEAGGHRLEARLSVLRDEAPRVLAWCAALTVAISGLNWLEEPEAPVYQRGFDLLAALVLAACSLVLIRGWVRGRGVPWITALGIGTLALCLLAQISIDGRPIGFAYLLVVLIIMGPIILDWAAWGTTAAVLSLAVVPVVSTWPPGHAVEWFIVAVTGLLAGGFVLAFRLRSINALSDAQDRILDLATSDELTGLLNRHGFNEQAPRLDALASRLNVPVFAVFLDIDGLKTANDSFGHAFGDQVIQACARAAMDSARAEDLVARWGGDEIVILGVGEPPEFGALHERLMTHLGTSAVDRGRWPHSLSLGLAVGYPGHGTVEELLARADEDMYRRRRARRDVVETP